jgi:hypothetical protein
VEKSSPVALQPGFLLQKNPLRLVEKRRQAGFAP